MYSGNDKVSTYDEDETVLLIISIPRKYNRLKRFLK